VVRATLRGVALSITLLSHRIKRRSNLFPAAQSITLITLSRKRRSNLILHISTPPVIARSGLVDHLDYAQQKVTKQSHPPHIPTPCHCEKLHSGKKTLFIR